MEVSLRFELIHGIVLVRTYSLMPLGSEFTTCMLRQHNVGVYC